MIRMNLTITLAIATAIVAGCAPGPLDDPLSSWPKGDPGLDALRRRIAADVGRVPKRESTLANATQFPDNTGVDDYVRYALEHNAGIVASRQKVARLTQRVPQAVSLDDPMFQIAPFGEMAETAAGEVGLMTGISQRLPTPGKLDARGRIAGQQVAVAVAELNERALAVVADVRRAYWSLYFTVRAIEVTQNNKKLIQQFRDIADAKLRANTATQPDVLRASVELSNIENELIGLRQKRTAARAMLNQLMNRPVTTALSDPEPVDLNEIGLELDALIAAATLTNPGLAKTRERIREYRERVKLARLNRWPDLTVSANYNAVDDDGLSGVANGDDQWWFGFGFNLPIWVQRLDAAEREANRGVLENLAELTDTSNRVAFRVQDALSKVEADQQLVILFRDVIIPQARQTVDASLSGYRAGTIDFLTLVDNWRKLLNFQVQYHRNLTRLEQDFADLQEAVGRDLQRNAPNNNPNNAENQP